MLFFLKKLFYKNEKLLNSLYTGFLFRIVTLILRTYSIIYLFYRKEIFDISVLSTSDKFKFYFPLTKTEDSLKDEFKQKYPTLLWRCFGIYEPYTSLALKEHLRQNDVFLELGAARGYFTLQIAKLCKECHSVEPIDEMISIINENLRINNVKNVKIYKKAIGLESQPIRIRDQTIRPINLKKFLLINKINPTFIFVDCDSTNLDNSTTRNDFIILQMIFDEFKTKKIKIIFETKNKDKTVQMCKKMNFNYYRFSSQHFLISN